MTTDARIAGALTDWLAAPHGGKRAIVERLAADSGLSVQTVYRRLHRLAPQTRTRKRRSDAGRYAVSASEAQAIATLVEETRRETGTGALPLEDAVAIARSNGLVTAERFDRQTGEIVPVGLSTIRRALRRHFVHPKQLAAPSAAGRLSSPHPNYLWQVDASISTQYYLADDGVQPMPKSEFYSGKPQNFERIARRRLWRYVLTDHASGCIELFYVLGSETSANLAAALIHAMTRRPRGTMHGVPQRLMADPGSAVTASATANLCAALGIELMINQVGNARAKGQVENAHYLVETHFEARLALQGRVRTLEEINTLAEPWCQSFNAVRTHTRTGMTRRDGWLRITREQLVEAPSIELLRQLVNSTPKLCKVRDYEIQFKGATYDLRGLPELINGDRVGVVVNALDAAGSVRVLREQAGEVVHYIAPRIERDDWGFLQTAAQVGQEFKSPPQSPAEAAAKELERTAFQVRTDEEAKAARKAKRRPFAGRIDAMKDVVELVIPPALPRSSSPAQITAPKVIELAAQQPAWPETKREFAPYTHVEAARTLKPLIEARGLEWSAAMMQATIARFPDGVPYDQLESWAHELSQQNRLRLVAGKGIP